MPFFLFSFYFEVNHSRDGKMPRNIRIPATLSPFVTYPSGVKSTQFLLSCGTCHGMLLECFPILLFSESISYWNPSSSEAKHSMGHIPRMEYFKEKSLPFSSTKKRFINWRECLDWTKCGVPNFWGIISLKDFSQVKTLDLHSSTKLSHPKKMFPFFPGMFGFDKNHV